MLLWFQAPNPGGVALFISLSVPAREDVPRIDVTGPIPHFHDLVSNRSGSPLRVWEDTFSWGYYALRFEITDAGGHTSVVHKKQVAFARNFPASWKLQPGEQLAIDVHLADSR